MNILQARTHNILLMRDSLAQESPYRRANISRNFFVPIGRLQSY
jgi:hypothetical protein